MQDDQNNKDDGSVWTSYSDLFTTVAVIFLVMFVFALIKAGVSNMKTVFEKRKHEQELKGEVTKDVKKETDLKVSKVSDAISDITQYENIIDQKMKDMNKFVNSLQENKKVLNELIQDQQRKEAQLAKASSHIKEQEAQIEETIASKKIVEKNLEMEKLALAQMTNKNDELNKTLEEKQSTIEENLAKIQSISEEQAKLTETYNSTVENLNKVRMQKRERNSKVRELNKNLAQLTAKRSQEITQYSETIAQNEEMIENFQNEINVNKEIIAQAQVSISLKEKIIQEKAQEILAQNSEIEQKKQFMEKQVKEIDRLANISRDQAKEISNLQVSVTNHIAEIAQFKNQNDNLQDLNAQQKEKITILNNHLNVESMKLREKRIALDNLQKQHLELIAQSAIINDEKDQAQKQVSKLAQDNKAITNNFNELQKIQSDLKIKLSQVELKKNQFESDNLKLKTLNKNLENDSLNQIAQMGRLNNQIEKLKADQNYFKNELSQKSLDVNTLQASLENVKKTNAQLLDKNNLVELQNNQMQNQMQQVAINNSYLEKQNEQLQKQNQKQLLEKQDLERKIASVNEKLNQQLLIDDKDKKLLQAKIDELQNRLKEKKVDDIRVAELNKKNEETNIKLNTCEKDLDYRVAEVKSMESKFNEKFKNLDEKDAKLNTCMAKATDLDERNKNLKESLNDFAHKVANVKGKLRSGIAKDLAKAFEQAKLNVLVDNKTGNVVLQMNENFRFKKNSYYLNKKAKETLKKIIPIYSKVLFGNKNISNKINSFNVVGHASPSFRGKYVDPEDQNSKAYSYNMRLSAQRASSITNYIFSDSIGSYEHKSSLQVFTKAIGQGYIKPVPKVNVGRSLASTGTCGKFDCFSSQRVEISFTLKDDVNSINELIEMSKSIGN